MPTDHLPWVRRTLLYVVLVTCGLNFLATGALLIFQLTQTSGYQRPVPAILGGIVVAFGMAAHFLWSRPMGTSKTLLFLRSLAFELICWAGAAAYLLVSVINLHTDTPGLLQRCGGFLICRMLTACAALTWLSFLFFSLLFTFLLLSILYFTVRRKYPIRTVLTPFSDVNWALYAPRPQRSFSLKKKNSTASSRRGHSAARQGIMLPEEEFENQSGLKEVTQFQGSHFRLESEDLSAPPQSLQEKRRSAEIEVVVDKGSDQFPPAPAPAPAPAPGMAL